MNDLGVKPENRISRARATLLQLHAACTRKGQRNMRHGDVYTPTDNQFKEYAAKSLQERAVRIEDSMAQSSDDRHKKLNYLRDVEVAMVYLSSTSSGRHGLSPPNPSNIQRLENISNGFDMQGEAMVATLSAAIDSGLKQPKKMPVKVKAEPLKPTKAKEPELDLSQYGRDGFDWAIALKEENIGPFPSNPTRRTKDEVLEAIDTEMKRAMEELKDNWDNPSIEQVGAMRKCEAAKALVTYHFGPQMATGVSDNETMKALTGHKPHLRGDRSTSGLAAKNIKKQKSTAPEQTNDKSPPENKSGILRM